MKKKLLSIILVLAITVISFSVAVQASSVYTVKSGDTLWRIADYFGMPISTLVNQNNLSTSSYIYIGQRLVIRTDNNNGQYTVQTGDTLWSISRELGTTVEKLVQLNNLSSYNLYIGQKLIVPGYNYGSNNNNNNNDNNGSNNNSSNYTYYTIQPGDILWNIAQKYNTTVKKLVNLNYINNAYDLYVGRRIIVPVTSNNNNNDNQTPAGNTNKQYSPYFYYKVKAGDRIQTVAEKFGLRVSVLINYNNIENINDIQVGDLIIIPLRQANNVSYLKQAASVLNNTYRVSNNETLAEIADYYGIPEEGLRAINSMTANEAVYAGQNLLMPLNPALFVKHELYRVKAGGEYLFDIAYNKGVSIRSILKANYLRDPNKKFQAGSVVLVALDQSSKATWIDYENGKPVNSPWFN